MSQLVSVANRGILRVVLMDLQMNLAERLSLGGDRTLEWSPQLVLLAFLVRF